MKRIAFLLTAFALTAGCNAVPEPEGSHASPADGTSAAPPSEARIAGYQHGADASRFRLGEGVVADDRDGMKRLVGREGVLAFGRHGVTMAVPNADAHCLKVPALPRDGGTPRQGQPVT